MQDLIHAARIAFRSVGLAIVLSVTTPVHAQAPVLANDCGADIITYCSQVTPGGDRVVSCLIAYEDKVSPRCRLTAYLFSGSLDARNAELRKMAKVCSPDILQYCSKVQAGGGRVYDCLKKNRATLTDDCRNSVPTFEKLLND